MNILSERNIQIVNDGGIGRDEDGHMHPTAAGLLMFGFEYEMVKEGILEIDGSNRNRVYMLKR